MGVEPIPLNSLEDFNKVLLAGPDRVKAWLAAGAPIAIERDSLGRICRYSADYHTLQAWRVEQGKKVAS